MLELLQYTFFQHALIASLLTGVVCGMVGCYIVSRRMVFVAGGIAHTALGGVGVCALTGLPPMTGASAFALAAGWGIQRLSRRREVREDSAIAMLWALGMSIGIICSYLSPEFLPSLSSYLFGNILLINATDLWLLAALALITTLLFVLATPQIASTAFDTDFAQAQKQPIRLTQYIMISLVALSIVFTLKVAGVVLVISLLSVPQMTANLFCKRFGSMIIWSAIISTVGCLGGLVASIWLDVPCGTMVVATIITIYIICRTIKGRFLRSKV